ncbi:phage tail assembly chaperone [Celerinatantimonas sp. MCCC 1A17872]|uniref:phage tail assembly chaperone n=1 Tax=Celerinatantimonas sp. MCCC 1A17872 TaxID=3177514 RepID=UPI0038CA2532
MRYFKDDTNQLYAYDNGLLTSTEKQAQVDAAQAAYDADNSDENLIALQSAQSIRVYIKDDLTELSETDYQAAIAPTDEQKQATEAAAVRATRDELADRTSREINRLEDAGTDASDWRQYRIALRNVPEQDGFPFDVQWPETPGEFTGK